MSDPDQTRWVSAFAPASVANLASGFDLLAHSFDGPRDIARVRRSKQPGVTISAIEGCVVELPKDPIRNTAGLALLRLCESQKLDFGFELQLQKGIPLGSGLGGSAASCVAALIAANALLDQPLPREALYELAIDGETAASGSRHGDNVGAALFGGVILAGRRPYRIPCPNFLYAAIVHPEQILETRNARAALSAPVELHTVVDQCDRLANLLIGLQQGDLVRLRLGLEDVMIEPRRAAMIPHFPQVKQAALDAGAIGASISGGGPSVFAWFENETAAQRGGQAMRQQFIDNSVHSTLYVVPVRGPGADLLV